MSRGCTDDFCISLQKHRNRLLQLAESKSTKAQRHSLKNLYTAPLKKGGQQSSNNFSNRKLRSLEEVVRSDPGYTPDIEHLVFQSQSRTKLVEVGVGRSEPVHAKTEFQYAGISTARVQQQHSVPRTTGDESMAARGYNVSVLHLRNSSEPWEPDGYSTRNYETNRSNSTRRKENSSNSNPNMQDRACCRELSPVRWCDKEVDGVYLGKSGWVQVQQRSLDDNLSLDSGISQAIYNNTSSKERKAISKMYTLDNPPKRPVFLKLSSEDKLRDPREDMSSPPPITPIISPPPAFQDPTLPRPSPKSSKALARSNAVENTPPQSPSMRRNYFNLPAGPTTAQRLTPSPISSPQAKMLQTRSLEDSTRNRRAQFQQKHDSSSSSSSSFGFRSLDGGSYPRKNISRLTETNSSLGLYDNDGDEEDNRSPSVNVLMVNYFPDSNQHQSRHAYKHTRKSPCTEAKKVTPCSCSPSSSSSTSSSRSPSASNTPFKRSASHNNNKQQWDNRSHKVRRSRSLQLPERSPSLGRKDQSPSDYLNYNSRYKPQAGFNNTQSRKQAKPPNLRYMNPEDKMRREAEEEARIVTEYLYGTRSREAARALLMQRCCEKLEEAPPRLPVPTETSYSVYLVPSPSQPRLLKRGLTSPSLGSDKNEYGCTGLNPCNPTTCDFWPHCSHRDGISTVCKSPNSYPYPQQSNGNSLKASQSYPSSTEERFQNKHNVITYSSPPSLEQMNEKNLSVGRGISPCNESLRGASPSSDKIRASPCGNDKVRISPCVDKMRVSPCSDKMRVSPCSDKMRVSPCSDKMRVSPCSDRVRVSPCGDKVRASPAMCNGSGKIYSASPNGTTRPPSGCGSSSSSDVWYTVSDRTTSKEMKTARSSGTCTPSLADSPNSSRPGSAPARSDCCSKLDAKQRSLSLPKSFQTNHKYLPHRRSDAWPGGLSAPHSTRTAPATPIRDLLNGSASTSEDNLPGGISKSSSTPLLDDPNPSWEWSQMNKAHDERIAPLLEAANQRHFSGYNVTESVLQKFRKSFSLRFYKKSSSNSSASSQPEPPHPTSKQYETQHSNDFEPPDSPPHTDQKFRFGPLIWRSSKERRKGKKASRNQKCNSGDSGIQIEMVGRGTGDSSESHDTDHLADEEILDDTDSPLVVRRRGPGLIYGSEGKASRPTSDVINQVLIDKLKTELQSRGLPRRHGQAVRRTHSDLGGQRLFHWDVCHSYRKMMSSPSPVKMRNQEYTSSGGESQAKTKKIRPHHTLRRSVSQPLGLNELSPLLRRKPIGSRTSNTLSDDDKPPSGNQGQTGSVCSDDELLSDSESSVTSLGDRKRGCGMDDDFVVLAEAVWDHIAMEPEELGFRAGDVIEVLDTMDRDWWWGTRGEASGWFPAAFVRLRVSQEDTVEDCLAALASGGSKTLRRRTSISLLSNDQVRSRVVRELINTERDFVKVLHDVSEGYLAECRRRSDMFSSEQIQTIFGNLEHILAFQSIFLEDLETKLDWEAPYKSCIGETFLKHKSGFRMYSEYCNSHPMAIATLQELYQHNNYSKFFEACRLMRGLIEIPLDGYLLTPVQRICKYPLQLAELLKYTKTDHPDYVKITEALEAMRDVAMLINERKRRMESLEKLAAWQQRVEGWEGEDLIETSSQLIHQGEVIRVTSGMWTNSITLFLFDHQLVYCKRDILKRNTHVYKARLNIDTSQIINLPDGKDPHLGVSVRHAIKVHCTDKDKWLLFCCRSNEDKTRWLASFEQERALVEQDREDGLEFAPAAKELARMSAARCHSSRPPVKHRSKRSSSQVSPNATMTPRSHSLGRRVGTWFNFGANKKNRTFTRAATLQTVVHPS